MNGKLATLKIGDTGTGWFVYMIQACDGKLYTGITLDIERRWTEHNSSGKSKGAKFFRGTKPKKLVFLIESANRSTATKEEMMIKKLSRAFKFDLIESRLNRLCDFEQLAGLC